jgi:hypothetical protein
LTSLLFIIYRYHNYNDYYKYCKRPRDEVRAIEAFTVFIAVTLVPDAIYEGISDESEQRSNAIETKIIVSGFLFILL